MNALLHCPFCGYEPEYKIVNGEKYKALAVVCKRCGACGPKIENRLISFTRPVQRSNDTKLDHVVGIHGEEAAKAWNRRA